jgi:hypothetical protein
MTLAAVKGTEGVELFDRRMLLWQVVPATTAVPLPAWEWPTPGSTAAANRKSILIPAGAANGIAIKNLNAQAGATVDVCIEFVETSFAG